MNVWGLKNKIKDIVEKLGREKDRQKIKRLESTLKKYKHQLENLRVSKKVKKR